MSIYNQEKKFYVYQYLRNVDSKNGSAGTPYYIGKGRERRAYRKHEKGISVPKDKTYIQFIAENISEADAFQIEVLLIHLYGRLDLGTGCLRNRTVGGDGSSGTVVSAETRKKLSLAGIGEKNPFFGKSHSEESNQKNREAHIGKINSEETRKKISIGGKGKKRSPETKNKIASWRTGKIWIYHPILSKRTIIHPNQLEEFIKLGYKLGRS